ncbi:quinone oxidoreductase family protein [Allokutzneria oryzae]|uniref:Zinc-binding alcohol dehydrogenase family protein n=1 Tax=Allokutzneria oryzae TaxID=1378989 RepID=A0ABV6A8T3_9PSEU
MRRVRFHEYGGPEVLRVERAEVPAPGPGQVLIRAEAIGANFVDTKFRAGTGGVFQRPLPGELTGDVVGVVEALGPNVVTVRVSDRVAALADPAFAEYVLADADWLAPVPDGIDDTTASMLPMAAPVALRALRVGRVAPGETVVVHAAAGGIGHLAVQLAQLLGAGTVIATASTTAKLDFARSYGADIGVNYTEGDWQDQVRAAAPNGVDVVLDSIGGAMTQQSIDLLAPFGRTVVYGAASGEIPDIPATSLFGLKYVAGFSLLAWRTARPEQARQEMTELSEHVREGRLRAALHSTFPLADAAKAHQLLEDRGQLGRVLLIP